MRVSDFEVPPPGRAAVFDTDWSGYEAVLALLEDCSTPRVTYDQGRLELMTPSAAHETVRWFLPRVLEELLEAFETEHKPGGSTTFKDKIKQRGLEPDCCFWITRWQETMGFGPAEGVQWPPPDLAIEVELTTHILRRLPIYRDLAVPEVWRWTRRGKLLFLHLTPGGYEERPASQYLPRIAAADIEAQVLLHTNMTYTQWKRATRAWACDLAAR